VNYQPQRDYFAPSRHCTQLPEGVGGGFIAFSRPIPGGGLECRGGSRTDFASVQLALPSTAGNERNTHRLKRIG
jgi:hypothetical protein